MYKGNCKTSFRRVQEFAVFGVDGGCSGISNVNMYLYILPQETCCTFVQNSTCGRLLFLFFLVDRIGTCICTVQGKLAATGVLTWPPLYIDGKSF